MDAEPVKFCKDCKHFDQSRFKHCLHPKSTTSGVDTVTGTTWSLHHYASTMRGTSIKCGERAHWFEPIPSKKPWLDRVIAYFK